MTIRDCFFPFVCISSGVNRIKSKRKKILCCVVYSLFIFIFLSPARRTGILQGVFLADRSGEKKNGPCGRNKQIARRARSKKNNEQKKLPTRKELQSCGNTGWEDARSATPRTRACAPQAPRSAGCGSNFARGRRVVHLGPPRYDVSSRVLRLCFPGERHPGKL